MSEKMKLGVVMATKKQPKKMDFCLGLKKQTQEREKITAGL